MIECQIKSNLSQLVRAIVNDIVSWIIIFTCDNVSDQDKLRVTTAKHENLLFFIISFIVEEQTKKNKMFS